MSRGSDSLINLMVMRVFVIPSWYPSESHPSTGIFFRQQAKLVARHRPEWKVGISLWGSHEPELWLRISRPLDFLFRVSSRLPLKSSDNQLQVNCAEFFTPAFTWSRRIFNGNFQKIYQANERNLERFIRHWGRPDVIHAHVAFPAGEIARRLSQKEKIPFVITEHMSPFPMRSFKRDYKRRLLPPLKEAHTVLVVGEYLTERLATFGIENEEVSNFIDDQFFTPGKTRPQLINLIAVGRLEEQKNYQDLIDAVAQLKNLEVDFKLRIVGSGSEERSLKNLSDRLNIRDHVEWLGECSQEKIRDVLQQSHMLINTSRHENQPVAILEALACGVYILSYDWEGARAFIPPQAGSVVESSPEALSEAIVRIVNHGTPDQSDIRAVFEQTYGTSRQVSHLEDIYRRIILRHGTG